ncbi:hypothetical protein ACFQZC_16135 [Streptacidiphilus monticola]
MSQPRPPPGGRCAAAVVAVGGALVAPFAWFDSRAMLEQVVRFPLGLSRVHTPPTAPCPGTCWPSWARRGGRRPSCCSASALWSSSPG